MMSTGQSSLIKSNIVLTVLNESHENALTALASEKAIWEFATENYYEPEIFKKRWFDKAMDQMNSKERVCFVIFHNNKMVGSSSYYEIDLPNKKTNIGYTWFHPKTWGQKINPLSKLIMLEHAFEILKLNRAGFSVDSINKRSCRALEKLGIQYEGTLRNHLVLSDQRIRHSAMFSVTIDEWADTKDRLQKIAGV